MRLILAVLLAQSVWPGASADDEYFQKEIFRVLKEKNGQFNSSMQMTRYRYGHRSSEIVKGDLEEKYSFKTNTGFYTRYRFGYPNSIENNLYNGKELYTYEEKRKRCHSYRPDKYEKWYHFR